jgi:hypothetical protein
MADIIEKRGREIEKFIRHYRERKGKSERASKATNNHRI